MRNKWSKFFFLAAVILAAMLVGSPTKAAQSEDVGFNIQMIPATNQIDRTQSYFDLRMQPNQKQTVYVKITNTSAEEANYAINVNQAYTNDQGFIDYTTNKTPSKKKMPFSIDKIANYDKKISLKGQSSIQVPITLTMPKEKFDGQILSGIQVTRLDEDKSGQINNRYGYVLGLKLTETDTPVKRDLQLKEVFPKAMFGKPAIVAKLSNPTMDAYGHLKYTVEIKDKQTAKKIIQKTYDSDMQMAPNSTYDFAIEYKENDRLPSGQYVLDLTITDAKKNKWTFNRSFEVSDKQVDKVNSLSIGENQKTPIWIYIIGILIVLLVIGGIILIMRKRKQKKGIE